MTYQLPAELPHLTSDDAAELTRLLMAVFQDEPKAADWLKDRHNGIFHGPPLEALKRDAKGVADVLAYLRRAAP